MSTKTKPAQAIPHVGVPPSMYADRLYGGGDSFLLVSSHGYVKNGAWEGRFVDDYWGFRYRDGPIFPFFCNVSYGPGEPRDYNSVIEKWKNTTVVTDASFFQGDSI